MSNMTRAEKLQYFRLKSAYILPCVRTGSPMVAVVLIRATIPLRLYQGDRLSWEKILEFLNFFSDTVEPRRTYCDFRLRSICFIKQAKFS